MSAASFEPDRPAGGPPTGRALVAGALLGLGWMLGVLVPRSGAELPLVRLGDLRHGLAAVLVAVAGGALVGLALRARGALAHGLAAVVLAAVVLGWPVLVPSSDVPRAAADAPFHAAGALALAFAALRLAASSRRVPVLAGAAASGLALGLGAFAAVGVERNLPPIESERVLLSLLDEEEARTVVRENPASPVAVSSFETGDRTQFDSGLLPVLEMRSPARVQIEIPPTEPEAVLQLTAGIAEDSYVSKERTRAFLEASFEGQRGLAAGLTTWKRTPPKERVWKRGEIPVGGGGQLVLRSRFDGPEEERPRAGFGLLRVVAPAYGRRSLASRREPNAVLIVIDTLRADRLSAYGNPREASPALDALAARGTLFETAFSAASWTWPSTASMLTSLTPPEHGVLDQTACYLSESLVTLADVFQAAGFTTAGFSSNPLVSADKNFDKGFESFREYHWDPASTVLADAEAWLAEMGRYRFFLYVHLTDPHGPYEPEAPYEERFALPAPEGYSLQEHGRLVARVRRSEELAAGDRAQLDANSDYLSSLYDGEVATADRAIAGFLDALERAGLADRTVVAVTSDHGEEFLEHGMMGHGRQIYEESVRVPLLLAGPGVPRGERVPGPVENRFIGPTLLALCGIDPVGNLAGRPNLLDPTDRELRSREPIFFASELGWWPGHGARALRGVLDGDGLLVWSPPREEGQEDLVRLFDLAADPRAQRDVAADHPDRVAELRTEIEAWIEASEAIRPAAFDGGEEVRAMLEDLGYIGD